MDRNDDIIIFSYYLGDVTINEKIRSPLRKDDDTPSFMLTLHDGRIKWKDWGLGEGGSAIDFVMYVEVKAYAEAMSYYYKTIRPSQSTKSPMLLIREKSDLKPEIEMSQNFTSYELRYWAKRGITHDDLIRKDVYRLESLKWNANSRPIKSSPKEPKFVYRYGDESWKIYSPLSKNKRFKWQSYNLKGVIEGWRSLPDKGKVLIISSSLKDGMVIENITNIPTISPTGEHAWKYIMAKKKKISKRFKRIIVLYDADDAGFNASKKLALLCGWEYRDLRGKLTSKKKQYKDFDEMKVDGVSDKKMRKLVKKLINKE